LLKKEYAKLLIIHSIIERMIEPMNIRPAALTQLFIMTEENF